MNTYESKLQQEAALWGSVDVQGAVTTPPDWRIHRDLLHNIVMHTADVDALLALVAPGMQTLELGCGSGWLTLAMAQQGATATGLDISERSLDVATIYYDAIAGEVTGCVMYEVADLNRLTLPAATYDMIVTRGTLHHLIEMEHVVAEVYKALKPGGLFWVSDQDGDEALHTALFASALMFVLPTVVSYRDKVRGLLQFGVQAPQRIKASMEAEGLSPFEGAGREHDWVSLVKQRFLIERQIIKPAVTGYMAHQLDLPYTQAVAALRVIKSVDNVLTKLGVIHSTGVILYARKPLAT